MASVGQTETMASNNQPELQKNNSAGRMSIGSLKAVLPKVCDNKQEMLCLVRWDASVRVREERSAWEKEE